MIVSFISCSLNGFIFSQAGISRSACLVIAYLMKHRHMTLRDAFLFVKEKRHQIGPNRYFIYKKNWQIVQRLIIRIFPRGFMKSLGDYEQALFGTKTFTIEVRIESRILSH